MILLFIKDYGNTIYIYDISSVSPMSNFTQSVISNTILIVLIFQEKKKTFTLRTNYYTENKLLYTKQITTKTRHYFFSSLY